MSIRLLHEVIYAQLQNKALASDFDQWSFGPFINYISIIYAYSYIASYKDFDLKSSGADIYLLIKIGASI